ncbi:MAG: hypothetical protein CSA20_00720 [Deltaproteobacteria bacterium]|nr:MAG: hypothetical protein CSA20_00720 [Deltaproteobacteria bacterium]
MHDILYICGGRSFYSSSPGRKIGEVVKCWRTAGHDVKHVCGGDILSKPERGRTPSVAYGSQKTYTRWYKNLPGTDPVVHTLSEWLDIHHDKQMLTHLYKQYSSQKFRLVWERSSRLHASGLYFARQINVPYVLEWKDHLIDYDLSLFRSRALRLEAEKNFKADFIVVESGVLKDRLTEEGVDPTKILVAHNAVDVTEFSKNEIERKRIRAKLRIDEDVVLAGYLGSYAFYHDAPCLVQAASLINEHKGTPKIKVLMAGAGKEYPESRELAEKLGVLDNTLLMIPGVPKDQVPGILSALDIAVLPGSTDIICPIKVQEYMANLLPTIAPDYACNLEVLQDGVTGELFTPNNPEALANKILLLAKDERLRLRLGQKAREEVARRFSWQATWGAALTFILKEITS